MVTIYDVRRGWDMHEWTKRKRGREEAQREGDI
jgi:hypothetical protein